MGDVVGRQEQDVSAVPAHGLVEGTREQLGQPAGLRALRGVVSAQLCRKLIGKESRRGGKPPSNRHANERRAVDRYTLFPEPGPRFIARHRWEQECGIGNQRDGLARERLGRGAGLFVPCRHALHTSEGQSREETAAPGTQRSDAERIPHDTRAEKPDEGDARSPVRHLDQAVVVLEEAAPPAEDKIASGGRRAHPEEATGTSGHDADAELPKRPVRIGGDNAYLDVGMHRTGSQAGREEYGAISEVAVGIPSENEEVGCSRGGPAGRIESSHGLPGGCFVLALP